MPKRNRGVDTPKQFEREYLTRSAAEEAARALGMERKMSSKIVPVDLQEGRARAFKLERA